MIESEWTIHCTVLSQGNGAGNNRQMKRAALHGCSRKTLEACSITIMAKAEAEPIHDTARLYHCARCHAQTMICRCCDRGNVYCRDCALPARREAERRASKRYQESPQGRLNHAARQRCYRSKQTEKVTHDGSIETERPVGHSAKQNLPISWDLVSAQSIICHFCFGICSQFLRLDYLLRPA